MVGIVTDVAAVVVAAVAGEGGIRVRRCVRLDVRIPPPLSSAPACRQRDRQSDRHRTQTVKQIHCTAQHGTGEGEREEKRESARKRKEKMKETNTEKEIVIESEQAREREREREREKHTCCRRSRRCDDAAPPPAGLAVLIITAAPPPTRRAIGLGESEKSR